MPIINSDIRNNNLMIQIQAYFLVPILEIVSETALGVPLNNWETPT
jgi:hypothetical protein